MASAVSLPGRSRIAAVTALVVFISACGLGAKQQQAERIHRSRDLAVDAAFASGTITFELIPPPPPVSEGVGPEQLAAVGRYQRQRADYAVDFAFGSEASQMRSLAEAAAAAPSTAPAAVVFRGEQVFVRRVNLRPSERRVWAKLDVSKLASKTTRPPVPRDSPVEAMMSTTHALNPSHLIDLARGALAGSVKVVGREDMHGAVTTRYDVNISLDRALDQLELDDEERVAREIMIRFLLGFNDDVRPASFWLDDEGRLRHAEFRFKQRVSRNTSNDLTITLDIPTYGAEVAIVEPVADETIEVERYGRLVRAAIPRAAR